MINQTILTRGNVSRTQNYRFAVVPLQCSIVLKVITVIETEAVNYGHLLTEGVN